MAQQTGTAANDWLIGDAGRDRLHGRGGDDRLEGGAGRDRLQGGRGDDFLSGGDGNDRLQGGKGNDVLDGGAGDDKAHGGRGDDVFVYRAGDGNDVFDGGRGTDTICLDSVAEGWTLHLSHGQVVANDSGQIELSAGASGVITFADGSKLRFKNVERIETVQSAPTPNAPPENEPTENGPTGSEADPGEPAPSNQAPSIAELSASSVYENAAVGTVVGVVAATDPDAGDSITYALLDDAGGRFTIDPASGAIMVADGALLDHEAADQHSVVVQVTDAGGLSDTATFSIAVQVDDSGDDTLSGGADDDVLEGGPGNDRIYGGAGNDWLSGGDGDDELDGGDGDDLLDGGDGADFLTGGSGNDQLSGGPGDDMLFGDDGDDWLSGGDGADHLHGGLGHDRLDGGDGDDWLSGNSGNDVLNGGPGDDTIFGGVGNDVIRGGPGNDTLSGGLGADRFVFDHVSDGVDVITDFGTGDVLAIGNALTGFAAGQEADFVRLVDDGVNTTVQIDGDGAANGSSFDSIVVLNGVSGVTLTALVNAGQIDFLIA